jgi:DNA-binding SARP family transcriptional activator
VTTATGALFRLRLLGAPELLDELGHTPKALGRGKPLALLCYLAVKGDVRRDEIVDLLWRDVDEAKARNAFRQALHRLRLALGDEIVPHDRDRLRLGDSTRIIVDLSEFERAAAGGRLDEAVELYSGDFLDGFDLREPAFDMWAEQERARVRGRFRQLLHDAALEATAAGRWEGAIAQTSRLLALTPFDSDAALLAATTLVSAGRRIEALELLRQFSARVNHELGSDARADIQALMARLSQQATTREPRAPASTVRHAGESLPLIGRQADLSRLLTLWRSVREDMGGIVLIEGDQGTGKSRLLREMLEHVRALGRALVLVGRERFAGAQVPYGVFAEALKPAVRAPGVAGASAHLLAEAARLLPELRDSLDLPATPAVEDESARLRFFEGVAAFVDAAAYEQHTIIAIEDTQHLPPSSLDLLSYLVARLAGAPVLFVLTLNPQVAPSPTSDRIRALATAHESGQEAGAHALHLPLAPLSNADIEATLSESSASLGITSASLHPILRAAQGNPLRLTQAIRAAAAGEPLGNSIVPLRDILLDRFQLLSSTQRRIYLVLSLLGRPADMQLLASGAHVGEPAASDALRLLEHSGWVERTGQVISVSNEAVADSVCAVAGAPSRTFLAGWIADAVDARGEADDIELARLYAMAGRHERAFACARRAGFNALSKGAAAEAAQLFTLARAFAGSPQQVAEMETALDAAGAGTRRLPGRIPAIDAAERSSPRARWAAQFFPHWQILLTAAIATAVIATVSLAARSVTISTRAAVVDTLVVVESDAAARRAERLVIGSLTDGFSMSDRFERRTAGPQWVDSVRRPWVRALASPRGDRVALARADSVESLVIVTADRRDTTGLHIDGADPLPLGWSPDGTRLLVSVTRRLAGGDFDSDLLVVPLVPGVAAMMVDSTYARGISEAQWSPDGSHIAWVSRLGARKQLEVFVGLADGSDIRNVSESGADDYHIAWSPGGDLLVFTSTRDGNPEIYTADLVEHRLWRVTTNVAHDDRATFAPSGLFIAFESTRDGFGGVYVVPPLGGRPRQVDARRPLDIAGWRSAPARYIDRVRIETPALRDSGATGTVSMKAFDRGGDSMSVQEVEWRILDTSVVAFAGSMSPEMPMARQLRGRATGLARIIATVGRWRSDTAVVRVGDDRVTLLDERFRSDWQRRWRALGDPEPVVARGAGASTLILRAPRSWDSGILSIETVPLLTGLSFAADIAAPFGHPADAGMVVTLSLAAPEHDADVDAATPQLLRLVSLSWNAESRRLIYSVGREAFSEPADSLLVGDTMSAAIHVMKDSTVSFMIAGNERWRSGLRVSGAQFGTRAQLWISGRATGDQVRVSRVQAAIEPANPSR